MTERKMFELQDCCKCGVEFGVPGGYTHHRQRDKKSFYCPNGHSMSYTESEADRLRRERDRLQQRLAQRDDEIVAEQKRTAAYKGQVTRLKKRSKAGMCPCCSRSFVNLQRHMATKHPDMDPAEPLRVVEGGKP